MKMKNEIALFDVCGTLYHSNTTYDFISFFLKRNARLRYYKYLILKSVLFKPFWKLSIIMKGNNHFNRRVFLSFLKNYNVNFVEKEADVFVKEILNLKINQVIHDELKLHLQKKHKIFLISASIDSVVGAIARNLKVDGFYATKLGITNGVYNGKLEFDMEGQKKAFFEKNFRNYQDNYVYFYSDNKEDINLLLQVNEPIVVCFEKDKKKYWNSHINSSSAKYILK
ncbi:HAD-IB family phosphatase [Flavobacterium capsici]|uniref:HAD-IB family phosphatase n=1 Tax=Flavobacterium capsici TaxID=3075618 RepID=A0AA96F0A4_9FLAO|nr:MULTISPECIES: HAD-IB family phosphatase [unclassified Flavobacterium]WNM20230.1 HAD-IB family phosphatase [Flavobacterium sp. PMR2A8]WNM21620.1 HAD-IB family phosphatase [Flavobacterium sp. PMTSA4]